ncbi:outer membrane protein assembly factor BamA [Pajaroellobacter abortibovis]|uniref:Outer membrane protein assembly factor BamA n=2 Tax=Pajaroellobacter abortibovis TaxID=1882918 RepID=A0A1L6MZB4_9BACT|nr:outer membrane protein assembly factor BamA [Pajaroellobacter abortibovis]
MPYAFSPSFLQSETTQAEGRTILRVEIRGNRRVSEKEIQSYMQQKVGTSFHMESLKVDTRTLWNTGFFEDIEVDLNSNDEGVQLRIIVRERPSIKAIEFEGNDELDTDKLNEIVEIKAEMILSIPAMQRSIQKIKEAYTEKGYFLATVNYNLEPQRNNEVIVRFHIEEHSPVTVRRVIIMGNEHIPDAELKDVIQTGKSGFLSFSGGPYRQEVLERDILMMTALYYDKGYIMAQFDPPRIMLTPEQEGMEIFLTVREGPRFKIRKLYLMERDNEGKEIEPIGGRQKLRSMLRTQPGDYFNRTELVKELQAIRTFYKDQGYAHVSTEPETKTDMANHEVDVTIPIQRGPLVTIERIEIKGNIKTRDKVIRRELEVQEGELFSETKLEESKRRIGALGYFEKVDISTEQGSSPDQLLVHIEVGEHPTGTFNIGAGFSSMENIMATAQVQQANLLGSGQSLSAFFQISSLRQQLNIRFYEPYFFNSDWQFSTDLFKQLYVFPDFVRHTLGTSLTLGYALIQPTLKFSLTASARHDSTEIGLGHSWWSARSDQLYYISSQVALANLFSAGRTISITPAITYDTRDNRLFPTSGLFLQASTEFASPILGSQLKFLKHRLTARFYYPLGGSSGIPGSGFVFKMNNELGLITSPDPEGAPVYARFFLGGILDVRGYRLRTLGPRLPVNQSLDVNSPPVPNGLTIGGNLEAYSNIEFEFPIVDKVGIRGVAFFDLGNAWNTESHFCSTTPAPQFNKRVSPCFNSESLLHLGMSPGVGFRWFSPMGPLRFEWAAPINRLPYEDPFIFEFMVGNFF